MRTYTCHNDDFKEELVEQVRSEDVILLYRRAASVSRCYSAKVELEILWKRKRKFISQGIRSMEAIFGATCPATLMSKACCQP